MPVRRRSTPRRFVATGLAVAALLGVTTLPAAAVDPSSPTTGVELALSVPTVTLRRQAGSSQRPNLGVLVVSHGQAIEVTTRRPSYRSHWVSTLLIRRTDGSIARSMNLPSALTTTFGITTFARAVVTDSRGRRVTAGTMSWCPGYVAHQSVDPGVTPDPVYPAVCAAHPFGFGIVNGLEAGWASALSNRTVSFPASAPDGTYDVTITVTPALASFLRIPKAGRTIKLSLAVITKPAPAAGIGGAGPSGSETDRVPAGDRGVDAITLVPHPSAAPIVAAPAPDTVPDLSPLPAFSIATTVAGGRDELRFGANTWNAGPGPLVVEGYRVPGTETMDAVQVFYRDGQPVGSAPIGEMVFHHGEGHDHWHFTDFTAYDLTDSRDHVVATSGKQAWCMAPTAVVDLTVAGATYRPGSTGLAGACGGLDAQWLRQWLPVGWGDTYVQEVAGQAIDITEVPNGRYWIRVTVNPAGKLVERDTSNNVSRRLVILGGSPGHRTVIVRPYQGLTFN